MSLHIDITTNLQAMEFALGEVKRHHLQQAHFRALNRAALNLRTNSVKLIRSRYNVKASDLKKHHIRMHVARKSSIKQMKASVSYNETGIRLIEFLKGSKKIENQKGKSVKRRRKLKVMITPGKVRRLKASFIQMGKGRLGIFKKAKGNRTNFYEQRVYSVAHVLKTKNIIPALERAARGRYMQVFHHEMRRRLDGTIKSVKFAKLKR